MLDACGGDCPKHRPNLPCDLELLREHIPQAFIAWDGQTRVREINHAAEVYMGAPRSAMLGKSFEEIFGRAIPAPLLDLINRVRHGEECTVEYESHLFRGRRIMIHAYPSDDGGAALFTNVSRQAELEARAAQSDSILGALAAHPQTAVFELDAFSRIVESSPQFSHWTGLERDALLTRPFAECLGREHRGKFQRAFINAIEARATEVMELAVSNRTQEPIPLTATIAPRVQGYATIGASLVLTRSA